MSARIFGSARRPDGSKVNGTMKVSTSWNGNVAFPKDGEYTLELGSDPSGQRITVYVDGQRYTEVTVNGAARLDIVV